MTTAATIAANTNTALIDGTNPQSTHWKPGDPSSFHDLFTSTLAPAAAAAGAASSTPAAILSTAPAAAPAPASAPQETSSPQTTGSPQPASAPFTPTYEQGATVSGPGGTFGLNPVEMATADTAAAMAAKLGGTVTTEVFGGGYSTSAPVREISFAGTNVTINAGLAASLFAAYGDAQGSLAWQTINKDLGRDPQSTGPVG